MGRPLSFAIVWCCIGSFASSSAHAQGNAVGADTLVIPAHSSESADSISAATARAIRPAGMKSPGRALNYSFLGTVIPVGIGIGVGQNEDGAGAGELIALGGCVVAPSLGHFYAQRYGRAIRGIMIRGAAAGVAMVALLSSECDECSGTDSGNTEMKLFAGGVALVGVIFLVADIAEAPHSARVHNEKVAGARVGVAPFAGPVAGAPGVSVRLVF